MKRNILPLLLLVFALPPGHAAEPTAEQLKFFESKIRPVLADSCYECHSASTQMKGGLALDTADAVLRGGDNGPAIIPGKPEVSLLIEAVRYESRDMAMPPRKNGGKLPDQAIHDLEEWVRMGAPDPRKEAHSASTTSEVGKKWTDYEDSVKNWWSWQLPIEKAVPSPKNATWAKTDIDRHVLANLENQGLTPVEDASAAALVRRLYFDLIGLPPRPQEAVDFVKNHATAPQQTIEKTVDALLASPQFGERWGRHWLDVARYAESSGKDTNNTFPHAWRYRDYVIASFNADKPFHQMLVEQIAGDLLPSTTPKQKADQLVATGFLAMGPKSLNEQNAVQYALDLADEQIDTVMTAFQATTAACARCHDHKQDPIPQREYYALAGIFLSTQTLYGTAANVQNRHATRLVELPADSGHLVLPKTLTSEERKAREEELASLIQERNEGFRTAFQNRENQGNQQAQQQLRRLFLVARIGQLEAELNAHTADGSSKMLCMGVMDQPQRITLADGEGNFGRRLRERIGRPREFSKITDSPLYIRGDAQKPADTVPRGFLSVATKGEAPALASQTSGRKELAEWMVSPGNPLTSRVIVNRVWHWLFGRGIVASVDNFGTSGSEPSNQALLDYLAIHFRTDLQWSFKKLIREIVLSRTYQLGTTQLNANYVKDPDNAHCWRMTPRRLDAEAIRDAVLTVSGQIELRPPIGSVLAYAGEGVVGAPRGRGVPEESLLNPAGTYRSAYLPMARDFTPEALAVFDMADNNLVAGTREITNVPIQGLFMLNSPFMTEQSRKFAEKLLAAYPPSGPNAGVGDQFKERVRWAYSLCFSRWPTESELALAQQFLGKIPLEVDETGKATSSNLKSHESLLAAWTSFCRALFASAEFRNLN